MIPRKKTNQWSIWQLVNKIPVPNIQIHSYIFIGQLWPLFCLEWRHCRKAHLTSHLIHLASRFPGSHLLRHYDYFVTYFKLKLTFGLHRFSQPVFDPWTPTSCKCRLGHSLYYITWLPPVLPLYSNHIC